jgi:hypothetical protein
MKIKQGNCQYKSFNNIFTPLFVQSDKIFEKYLTKYGKLYYYITHIKKE